MSGEGRGEVKGLRYVVVVVLVVAVLVVVEGIVGWVCSIAVKPPTSEVSRCADLCCVVR